jgi:creatinine amidohydrolase
VSLAPLSRRTSREHASAGRRILLVPVGSFEQHGAHLPLSTDTIIAETVCAAASRERDVDVAPGVCFGASGEHDSFAGLLSIGTRATTDLLVELVRSARASWRAVVLVCAHGGNAEALATVAATARAEGDDLRIWLARDAGTESHAGRTETSVMLAIDASLVRMDCVEPAVELEGDWLARIRTGGVIAVSPTGVLGDPNGADRTQGTAILGRWCAEVVAMIDQLEGAP